MNWIKKIFNKKKQYNFTPLEQVMKDWIKK